MTTLVAYYDNEPVDLKGKVEIQQVPMPKAVEARVADGALRPGLVYVLVPSPVGPPLHVPVATYDEWSLRDRYNEALRIVNTLGAFHVDCRASARPRRGAVQGRGEGLRRQGRHPEGPEQWVRLLPHRTGSPARDPRPLPWPHEPGFAAAVEGCWTTKPPR